jgi:hypothetical protein
MELGIPASGGPQTRLPSAAADDGDLVLEDVEDEDEDEEENEEKTGEDDSDEDVDMDAIDEEALMKLTDYAYKTDNIVSYISFLW